jgi:hypothetical protein
MNFSKRLIVSTAVIIPIVFVLIENYIVGDTHVSINKNNSYLKNNDVLTKSPLQTQEKILALILKSDTSVNSEIAKKIAEKLREQYSQDIHRLSVQASLFILRQSVIKTYAKHGLAYFNEAVTLAFPDYAGSILNIMDGIVLYKEWFEENETMLETLAEYDRNESVWQKRYEIFGSNADLIWGDAKPMLSESERETLKQIEALDQAFDMEFDTRLEQLHSSLVSAHGSGLTMFSLTPGVIATTFLSFESVQKDLELMDNSERQLKINGVRETLGFSKEQIEKLAIADQKRQIRWDNGYAYMQARQELLANVDSAAVEQELDELRNKYFKHEAQTFKKEEASGFFRYERPRVYGRN